MVEEVRSRAIIFACVLSLLNGCASTPLPEEFYSPDDTGSSGVGGLSTSSGSYGSLRRPNYKIMAPGYQFKLTHVADRNMDGIYRIGFNGLLALPYKVEIKAVGLTFERLEKDIQTAYRPFFKSGIAPKLEMIGQENLVDIRGAVEKPGKYLVSRDTSIDELFAGAGGFLENPKPKFVKIVRGRESQVIELATYYSGGDTRQKLEWYGGDIIFAVSKEEEAKLEAPVIHIWGEVLKPGDVAVKPGADALYYLNMAVGPDTQIDVGRRIDIIRGDNTDRRVGRFSLTDMRQPVPRTGDILYVQPDKLTSFEKTLGPVLQFLSLILTSALVFKLF